MIEFFQRLVVLIMLHFEYLLEEMYVEFFYLVQQLKSIKSKSDFIKSLKNNSLTSHWIPHSFSCTFVRFGSGVVVAVVVDLCSSIVDIDNLKK
jgi:hypothetical protein